MGGWFALVMAWHGTAAAQEHARTPVRWSTVRTCLVRGSMYPSSPTSPRSCSSTWKEGWMRVRECIDTHGRAPPTHFYLTLCPSLPSTILPCWEWYDLATLRTKLSVSSVGGRSLRRSGGGVHVKRGKGSKWAHTCEQPTMGIKNVPTPAPLPSRTSPNWPAQLDMRKPSATSRCFCCRWSLLLGLEPLEC